MEIKPFKAYRFNPEVVGDPARCISPPYDVIDDAGRESLYRASDYNIVHIISGKTSSQDNENDNVYTRAAACLNEWVQKGALKQDLDESIYAYIQNFSIGEKHYQRDSFIALGRIEPFGKSVRAHENTLSKPKQDRLNLLRATKAKFGLVYMLYDDPENVAEDILESAMSDEPAVDFTDEQDIRHCLYPIASPQQTAAITEMMKDKTCIIADGHHRYETALNYSRESDNPNAQYLMAAFSNTKQPGMVVLATNRLINGLEEFDKGKMLDAMANNFEIEKFQFDSPESRSRARDAMLASMKGRFETDDNAFGIYCGDGAFYTVTLKDKSVMADLAPGASEAWRKLDVTVLHKLILEHILGIDEHKLAGGEHIEYIKDAGHAVDESITSVDEGLKQAAFFMNPPKIDQIEEVAARGEKMPQKSTFFYPKVYTGLTIAKL